MENIFLGLENKFHGKNVKVEILAWHRAFSLAACFVALVPAVVVPVASPLDADSVSERLLLNLIQFEMKPDSESPKNLLIHCPLSHWNSSRRLHCDGVVAVVVVVVVAVVVVVGGGGGGPSPLASLSSAATF